MIVGTAGHIDHGKTALVRALTGVDADRLPEEKARGITLELGFAYAAVGGGPRMGFVDVPGHERLVRTMLAGATGIDCLMLVVAADDGMRPQTFEHLAIADLLGLKDALVVVTKADRVNDDRIAEVALEIEGALEGTSLKGAEIVAASAVTGQGVAEVATKLAALGRSGWKRSAGGRFRLAIDRAFTLKGVGLVVTGTAHSGAVKVGDHLALAPGGLLARVRGLRVNDSEAETGRAGQRCALNLTGPKIDRSVVERGMWATAPGAGFESARIDVRLRVSAAAPKPLKHWTPVHVHLGSVDVTGRVSLLETGSIEPGEDGLVRLLLDAPTVVVARDRVVIRDQSATRTIGGGRVVDPEPPQRNARKPKRLAELAAMDSKDPSAALAGLLALAPDGLDLGRFARARNLTPAEAGELWRESGLVRVSAIPSELGFTAENWAALREKITAALSAYQERHPDNPGATISETLRAAVAPLGRPAAVAALDSLVADGDIERFGSLVHLKGHEAQLTIDDENLWSDVHSALAAAGLDQPRVAALCELVEAQEENLRPALTRLARLGRLRWINKNYFVLPEIAAELARRAEGVAGRHPDGLLTVGQFRDDTQIHRHLTVPVLEFFDRVGFTARISDGRRIQRPAAALFGGPA